MNPKEFSGWLQRLFSVFPAAAEMFGAAAEPEFLRSEWRSALEAVDLADADEVVRLMIRGEIEAPKFLSDWSTFPAAVRRHNAILLNAVAAESESRKFRGAAYTVKCLLCADSGFVSIWHGASVRACLDGVPLGDRGTNYTAAAACTCRPAPAENVRVPGDTRTQFDPEKNLSIEGLTRPRQKMTDEEKQPYLDHLEKIELSLSRRFEWEPGRPVKTQPESQRSLL